MLTVEVGHRTYFINALQLARKLALAFAQNHLIHTMRILTSQGYSPLNKRGAELFFQVLTKRYECGSIIITTDIAFKD